jgi:NAD-dependent SIR2 family protein deacetylase
MQIEDYQRLESIWGKLAYEFECVKCGHKFVERGLYSETVCQARCPKCKDKTKFVGLYRKYPRVNINIPLEHQSTPKAYDTHPLDEGIPFGEVPGDEDYKDIDNPLSPKP